MTERRRLRAGQAEDGNPVPVELRRFVLADWLDDGPGDPTTRGVRARRRFSNARDEWATAHGYDVRAPYGSKPGRDWWAFLALCKGDEPGP